MKISNVAMLAIGMVVSGLTGCDDIEDEVINYRVILLPLNAAVTGTPTATADFAIDTEDDLFGATVTATGLDPVVHPMHIHAGSVCPTALADVNQDGFIDVVEGVPTYGQILMPLDTNLATQASEGFPEGTFITYAQSTTMTQLLLALQVPDADPTDAVTTLGVAGPLNLAGRTVVVHGVADPLPATVATIAGLPAATTLPVLCGVIQLVD